MYFGRSAKARYFAVSAGLLVTLGFALAAHSQEHYPSKPIRLVLGFAAGGGTDVIARGIAQKMGDFLGTQVFVDNRPGANGNIAGEMVAKASPDGYTLLYNTSSIILSPGLYAKLGYDVRKDLMPVSITANLPMIVVASPKLPVKSVGELVALLKKEPGALNYASAGNGNITHLSALLFMQATGTTATHIPYKGEAPAVADVAGNQVDFYVGTAPGVIPFIKDKRFKGLAVSTLKRMGAMPDIPTINETVAQGLELGAWSGVMAPAGTKKEVIDKLNSAIDHALKDKDLLAKFSVQGAEPLHTTPAQYGDFIQSELLRWTKIIKDNDVKMN